MTGVVPTRGEQPPGWGVVRLSWQVTIVLAVLFALGLGDSDLLGSVVAVVSAMAFVVGIVLMAYTYMVGVRRSRSEIVTVQGLFLLQGSAPPAVRRSLLGAFAVQCVVAIVVSSLRLYTLIAFASLAPLSGLGFVGLWAARYGTFDVREPQSP